MSGSDAPRRSTRLSGTAVTALVGVAVAWGISFVVVKDVGASMPPATLVCWRFGIAGVALVLVRPLTVRDISGATVRSGVLLGGMLGTGFLLCTYGMRTTSVVSSSFIVGTTVVFTPLVALIWFRRILGPRILTSTALAAIGLALLTLRGTTVGLGGLLILFAAVIWAVHLCALERWVRPDQVYASALVQSTAAAVTALAVGWLSDDPIRLPEAGESAGLIYLGAVATAAAFVALTWAQTRTDASTAAVLLTLEPVVGGAAAVALGEPLMLITAVGAAVVIGASGLATWRG